MGLFGKKKAANPGIPGPMGEMAPPEVGNDITSTVVNMQQQGMGNDQIVQELQREGYNSQQIFDAMNSAEPTNIPAGPIGNNSVPGQDMPFPSNSEPPIPGPGLGDDSRGHIEEMAEAIIDEKWEELVKSINKIIEWKEKIEGQINKVEQEIKDIKDGFNQLQDSIIGKINEYDKNIVNVGTEVKAMEKVFEKVLPTFTENVSELKRIVNKNKK